MERKSNIPVCYAMSLWKGKISILLLVVFDYRAVVEKVKTRKNNSVKSEDRVPHLKASR